MEGRGWEPPCHTGEASGVTRGANQHESLPVFTQCDGDDLNRDGVQSLNVPNG
jgi:hypothetical protein